MSRPPRRSNTVRSSSCAAWRAAALLLLCASGCCWHGAAGCGGAHGGGCHSIAWLDSLLGGTHGDIGVGAEGVPHHGHDLAEIRGGPLTYRFQPVPTRPVGATRLVTHPGVSVEPAYEPPEPAPLRIQPAEPLEQIPAGQSVLRNGAVHPSDSVVPASAISPAGDAHREVSPATPASSSQSSTGGAAAPRREASASGWRARRSD